MSVDIGIIGPAKSGKTTTFSALTSGKADTLGSAPNIGVAKIPDPRLKRLADMLQPKRVVAAEVRYIDIGASAKGMAKELAISGDLLNQLGQVETLINVVRAFTDESTPLLEGSVDIERDIASIDLELAFSDLAILERRLERIDISLKGAKPAERQGFLREQELLKKIKSSLEKDTPIRELKLSPEEAKATAGYQLLSAKPLLIVVNIGEEQLSQAESLEAELNTRYSRPNRGLLTICVKLESELSQLDNDDAEVFRAELGIKEPRAGRVINLSFQLLGLISFFTTVSNEVKAWPIQSGTSALKAAGKIHSDMERGFIRAEVISYDDLIKCGSLVEARKKGLLRLEGKNYIVQDGEVITFLFNV
ncbi:redox-regulated ATPase YchF [Chloroflexota bacterium]